MNERRSIFPAQEFTGERSFTFSFHSPGIRSGSEQGLTMPPSPSRPLTERAREVCAVFQSAPPDPHPAKNLFPFSDENRKLRTPSFRVLCERVGKQCTTHSHA